MRANRSSPSLERVPESTGSASPVPFSSLPRTHRENVAVCTAPFADFLARNGVRGEHRVRVLEGGAYRALGVALPSGRYALLVKYDAASHFEIALEVWKERHVFRADFYEVFKLLAVPPSTIQFCDGQVLWR